MTSLRELQDSFQRAILDGDDAVLGEIADTSREKRDVLLGVYRNAYALRLIEFLANDHEKLKALLGDEQFGEMARAYIAEHPSRTPNARWFGARLPDFLRDAPGYGDAPVLADLAALEKALNDVFDADDAEPLRMEDIAAVDPANWGALTFRPHPAAFRIGLATNAADIWRALHAGKTPPEPAGTPSSARVLVSREDGMAAFRVLEDDEAMMWDEAANGVTFSVLCEMMAAYAGEDEAAPRAAAYLSGWIGRGLLAK